MQIIGFHPLKSLYFHNNLQLILFQISQIASLIYIDGVKCAKLFRDSYENA